MQIHRLFAVACISDMPRSVKWYADFIGREPDERPMEGLAQWRESNGCGLQLVLDVERAGASLITIVIPEMNRARQMLAAAQLELGPNIEGDFGVIAQISDPDGNRITLAEPSQVT